MSRVLRRVLLCILAIASLVLPGAGWSGVTPTSIVDNFNGTRIDPRVWAWEGTNDPAVTMTEGHGALAVDVASTAVNDFNASLGTRCVANGDFDARLSFQLPVWPDANGVWVSLMAADTGGFNVYRVSWQFGSGQGYGAYLPPVGTSVDATGTSGILRLTRRGSTWAGSYDEGGAWVPIISGPGPTTPISFSPGVFNLAQVLPFGGRSTVVEFTRFQVTADSVSCPRPGR